MLKNIPSGEKRIYIISIFILVLTSIFSLGYNHFDEHFQILEFAGLKLNLTSAEFLSWEYHNQMRSSAQPIIVIIIYKCLSLFGVLNPFTIAFILRLLSAALTFVSCLMMVQLYRDKISNSILRRWFLVLTFLLWFAVYNGVRFSSENWSGLIFIIAFALFFVLKKHNAGTFLVIGALLGLSFLFRFQAGFLVAGFMAWIVFIKKEQINHVIFLFAGIALVYFLGVLSDRWFYGRWTLTAWNYFEQAVINGQVSKFGTDPWWYYFKAVFIQLIPPFSILIIGSVLLLMIFKRKDPVTWCILPFLLIHIFVGHKEIRFLFPIIGFLPIIIITAIEVTQEKFINGFSSTGYLKYFMKGFFIVNFVFLAVMVFRPADGQISLYKEIYNRYDAPATLYYIDKNPYDRILDIKFYKRSNLNIKRIGSVDSIPESSGRTQLIVLTNKSKPIGYEQNHELIYSTFPKWVFSLNFNHWLDRTKTWYVFEIKNI